MAGSVQSATNGYQVNSMFDRAVVAQNSNRARLQKLQHPGFFGAIKDKITFKSKDRQQEAEALKRANEIIAQMLEMVARAYQSIR